MLDNYFYNIYFKLYNFFKFYENNYKVICIKLVNNLNVQKSNSDNMYCFTKLILRLLELPYNFDSS